MSLTRGIKQEPSASAPNENMEMVDKTELAELRAFKRKIEEIEPEFQANKRRLKKKDLELQKDEEKLKQFQKLVATDVQFRPKRANIRLVLPDFAAAIEQHKETKYLVISNPVEVAGFQWKLWALRKPNGKWMELFLYAFPPKHYEGPFEFDVDLSLRIFNTFSSKDITEENSTKKFKKGQSIWGGDFGELKRLLDPANGFLQGDKSLQVEVDFTVKTATFDHFLAEKMRIMRRKRMRKATLNKKRNFNLIN